MKQRTGITTMPLDYGHCPAWLFERMVKLVRGIILAITEEFGPKEVLRRLADPAWFQSLSCLIGMDWNSSGTTTITTGALKEALRGLEKSLGIFVCGGKGKTSKKTPEQIQRWAEQLALTQEKTDRLIEASRLSAKVDNTLLQDGFQLYHHNLVFSQLGDWAVIQQGMSIRLKKARRYHWLSLTINDFIEEPHSGIASQVRVKALNLTDLKSRKNREIAQELVSQAPQTFLKDIGLIEKRQQGQLTLIEMPNREFYHHPVEQERFDLKRLKKTVLLAHQFQPASFEELLKIKGVGPRTIRALSLVAEVIYGAQPAYNDPARYSFAHGGKDSVPRPIDRQTYDQTLKVIEAMERGIKKSSLGLKDKETALKRLSQFI